MRGGVMDISNIVKSLLEQIKETVRSETVVGEPVQAEDSVIVPISRVTFGFGVGGGTGPDSDKGSGSGAGGGASIEPVAFVVVSKGKAQLLPLKSREATVTRIIDLVPSILEMVKEFHGKKKRHDDDDEPETKKEG